MRYVKNIGCILLFGLVAMSMSQCSSAQKLQKRVSFTFGEAYYQNWVAGVKGGGSGINVFIPIISNPKQVEFDSIFFRGKGVKLEIRDETLVIGRFKTEANQKQDYIMSNEPYAEYGNQIQTTKSIPFELKDDDCIISYKEGKRTKYFMIKAIVKKESTVPNK